MPRIIRIAGIGIAADELLRPVSNQEFANRLASREPELRDYWFNNQWFRKVGYFSNGVAWLRENYEPKFQEANGHKPDITNDADWALLWELVREETQTTPEWIKKSTGIDQRFEALPGVATSDLAVSAAKAALKISGTSPDKINGVFIASVTTDHPQTPPMAPVIAYQLGIPLTDAEGYLRNIAFIDGEAACTSFLSVLRLAVSALRCGECDSALVMGADVMSRVTSPYSRAFSVVLGDHGIAVHLVVEDGPEGEDAFPPNCFFGFTDGSCADLIMTPAGGSRLAITPEMVACPFDQSHLMRMDGPAVGDKVGQVVVPGRRFDESRATLLVGALRRAGYSVANAEEFSAALNTIELIVFHQANNRLLEPRERELVKRFGYRGRFYDNIERFGNTTAAANGLCLYEAWQKGILKKGMRFMVVAFGGGFTGMTYIGRWTL